MEKGKWFIVFAGLATAFGITVTFYNNILQWWNSIFQPEIQPALLLLFFICLLAAIIRIFIKEKIIKFKR